jgi:very-short-patch-repair endonuclease
MSPRRKSPLPEGFLEFARQLRSRQTDAEGLIWSLLRGRRFQGLKFRRQHPCPPYFLHFYCDELRLAIELDGGQHNSVSGRRDDARRSAYLAEQEIEVLRFWNHEVLGDLDAVLDALFHAVQRIRNLKDSV